MAMSDEVRAARAAIVERENLRARRANRCRCGAPILARVYTGRWACAVCGMLTRLPGVRVTTRRRS